MDTKTQTQTTTEPLWQTTIPSLTAELPRAHQQGIATVLSYKESMTQHLTTLFKASPKIHCAKQRWEIPQNSEAKKLHAPNQEAVWVREVVLSIKNEVYMFARSLFPADTLKGEQGQQLLTLGNQPLGPLLFKTPSLQRTSFDYAVLTPRHYEWEATQQGLINFTNDQANPSNTVTCPNNLWARRSLFLWFERPILLTEIFLPFLFEIDFPHHDY